MKNILIVSDLHITLWKSRNPNYRTQQPLILLKRLEELKDEYQAKELWIAGDILDAPVNQPRLVHLLKDFLKGISNIFPHVKYILGQHDYDYNNNKVTKTDTIITIFDYPNLEYYHDKYYEIEGNKVYFRDFTFGEEVIVKPCDVYISHVTLIESFGQKIDNSQFKLGIFGDIHKPIKVQNMYSVGTPYQIAISDFSESVGLLQLSKDNDPKFSRLSSSTDELQYVRMYYDNKKPEKTRELDVIVKSYEDVPIVVPVVGKDVSVKDLRSKDFLDEFIINNLDDKFSEIHNIAISHVYEKENVNLSFVLKSIEIRNFMSIQNLFYEFKSNKILFLSGLNGSGKTCIMLAIYVALFGDVRLSSNYTTIGKKGDIHLKLVLEFEEITYTIVRGKGATSFYIGSEQVFGKTKKDLDKEIYDRLPFLNYLKPFFIWAKSNFFNNIDRVSFFKNVFGLGVLEGYFNYALDTKKLIEKNIKEANIHVTQSTSRLEVLVEEYNKSLQELQNVYVDSVDSFSLYEDIDKYSNQRSEITTSQRRLDSLKLKVFKDIDKSIEELNKEIEEYKEKEKEQRKELNTISELKGAIKSGKTLFNKSHIECPNCNSKLVIGNSGIYTLEEAEGKLKDLEEKLNELVKNYDNKDYTSLIVLNTKDINEIINKKEVEEEKSKLEDILNNSDIEAINSKIKELQDIKSKLDLKGHIQSRINSLQKDIDIHKKKVDECNEKVKVLHNKLELIKEYKDIFDMSVIDGIPYKIISSISDTISDSSIKFTTSHTLASGEVRFSVSCAYKVHDQWIDYDKASEGQKVMMDLMILARFSKLVNGLGLVILDESLGVIDESKYEQCNNLIHEIQAQNILVSSQSSLFDGYDEKIPITLKDGVTVIERLIDTNEDMSKEIWNSK